MYQETKPKMKVLQSKGLFISSVTGIYICKVLCPYFRTGLALFRNILSHFRDLCAVNVLKRFTDKWDSQQSYYHDHLYINSI